MALAFGSAQILALSQTSIQAADSAYLAGSACQLQASWFDVYGNEYQPLAISYRLDLVCASRELEQILGWTSIAPVIVNLITVTSAQNAMINLTRESETHQALFQVTGQDNNVSYARTTFKIIRAVP
jgi:hypothetical protein